MMLLHELYQGIIYLSMSYNCMAHVYMYVFSVPIFVKLTLPYIIMNKFLYQISPKLINKCGM